MLDEKDLQWNYPIISLAGNAVAILALLALSIFLPICIPLLIFVILRAYWVNFLVNKKKKENLASFYSSLDEESKKNCFFSKYFGPSTSFFLFTLGGVDKIEDYRLIIVRPDLLEIYNLEGINVSATKLTIPKSSITSIYRNTGLGLLNKYVPYVIQFKNAEGETKQLIIDLQKYRDEFDHLLKSYYGDIAKI